MTTPVLLLAVFAVTLNACAQVVLRKLMLAVGSPPAAWGASLGGYALGVALNPLFTLGLACYGISLLVWLLVLARAEVSQAYPLLSIGYLITAAAGYFLLGESVGPVRLAGLALICVGITVVSRG